MRLVIKDFSIIKEADVKFKKYTVLIGEQASGKSLICKVFFFANKALEKLVKKLATGVYNKGNFEKSLKEDFNRYFPSYTWEKKSFHIELFDAKDKPVFHIRYSKGDGSPGFIFEKNISLRIGDIHSAFSKLHERLMQSFVHQEVGGSNNEYLKLLTSEITKEQLLEQVGKYKDDTDFFRRVTYIPSGRSLFSLIKDNAFSLMSSGAAIDPFLQEFGTFYERSKILNSMPINDKKIQKKLSEFDSKSLGVIKGAFHLNGGEVWITSKNSDVMVSSASSGQQEALPLVLALRNIVRGEGDSNYKTIVVEEPEAHLFPNSQKSMIELIFLSNALASERSYGQGFVITTHSTYILTCINNEALKTSSTSEVGAYFISDGTSRDIVEVIDDETSLISGDKLDEVSSELSEEFYSILENKHD